MRIKTIELNNYRAFYGHHKLKVDGKNLFMYGENGSGKSSLFYAIKDIFQSSVEDIDLNEVENIFIDKNQKGTCYVRVTFSEYKDSKKLETKMVDNKEIILNTKKVKDKVFEITANSKNTDADGSGIHDANKLKSFLTYKSLLEIHHIKKNQQIDLFDLLVKGVLKHFKFALSGGEELGQLWEEAETTIAKETGRSYPATRKRKEVNDALEKFNDAFGDLFNERSPEYILKHANPILEKFRQNIDLKLVYHPAKPGTDYKKLENNHVRVQLKYAGKAIKKPHLFLNEARLSAIAISIYLGMIKRHAQLISFKILFLDDIFIGLDIANRLPLLKILQEDFKDYQFFITTYDKPWFEYAVSHLKQVNNWNTMEFYAEQTKEGYEIPLIYDNVELIQKARAHYKNCDYKAAAVYARAAFEKILRKYCDENNKCLVYNEKSKSYKSEDFWKVVSKDVPLSTKAEIEQYRDLVLNPFSHYNTEKHEIKSELLDTIEAVEKLKKELPSKKKSYQSDNKK